MQSLKQFSEHSRRNENAENHVVVMDFLSGSYNIVH